jgi:DNA polymerase-4
VGRLLPSILAEVLRQCGVLAEGPVGPHGALENDARLRHCRGNDVQIGAFLRHTQVEKIAVGAPSLQGSLRAKIKEVTGLNASAGISYNKFLAKLALRPPQAERPVRHHAEMGPAFVEALPVGKFHGIGPATIAKMNSHGLHTRLDMRNQTLEFMQANFGKAGAYYYWISRVVDNREGRANRIRKSVGAENTFSSDLTEFDAMAAELQPLIDKVSQHCEDKGSRGRTVTLKVKFNDFEIITRSRSVPVAVSSRADLERLSIAMLQNEMPVPKPVRLLGVSLSSLQGDDQEESQLGLPI